MRLIPVGESYDRYVPYIESLNGQHSTKQAIRLKQLYYDFECDYIAMDTQGNGISLYDDLVKVIYDEDRDVEYPAWTCINNEKMADRAQDLNALPIIYSIKAVANNTINHQIAVGLRGALQKSKIKLLINELDGRDTLSNQIEEFDRLEEVEKAKLLRPYIQTTAMQNEIINLEWSMDSGWVKVFEVGSNRKDRYYSLGYANYFADLEEKKLKKDVCDDDDDIVYY